MKKVEIVLSKECMILNKTDLYFILHFIEHPLENKQININVDTFEIHKLNILILFLKYRKH